jgi:hypothetical protein
MADFLLGRLKFVWQGNWAAARAFVKDDIVYKDGTAWVCVTGHTSTSNFYTDRDASYWNKIAAGVNWSGAYSSVTTYQLNSLVTYGGNVYIGLADNNQANTPGVSANWTTFAAGSLDDVLTVKGDVVYRNDTSTTRLPIGTNGQILTVNSSGVPNWENNDVAGNVYYVSKNGSNSNNGTSVSRAFLTLRYACATVTGPATIYVKAGVYAEQLPITVPAGVTIIGDGMRDTEITPLIGTATTTYVPTGSTGTTIKVVSNTGIYAGMTVSGTNIGSGRTVISTSSTDTVVISSNPAGTPSGNLTFTYLSTDASPVVNNLSTMFYLSDSTMLQGLLFTGMTGFSFNGAYPTDITQATIGGVYCRLNSNSAIANKSPYVKDCTARSAGGIGAIVDGSVHTSGNKSMVFWAYNMLLDGGIGLWSANGGKLEAVSVFTYYCYMGYTTTGGGAIRSIAGNNSYGTYGTVSLGYLSSETPVTASVYGSMLTFPLVSLTGTFTQNEIIRQPNVATISITTTTCTTTTATVNYTSQGSSPFVTGQTIAVAGNSVTGYNGTWTVLTSSSTATTFSVAPATGLANGSGGTIRGYASAYITSVQTTTLYYKQQYGTFNTTNQVTGVGNAAASIPASNATMTPSSDGGQANAILVLGSSTSTPIVGASISFTSGDTSTYVISAVSAATINGVNLNIITLAQSKVTPSTDTTGVQVRYNFSLIRLQSHDFLSIGTGGIATTNYPGIPSQNPAPSNQIIAPSTQAGRVYYVATDELGNFNVGNYFSVNQATGSATLNASAFNLSGLTSLRLGSIGAQLGAQVNEFSTDGTMSQNSAVKVPTQSAVRTYLGASYQNFSPATDLTYDLGDATHRWRSLYVGAGSITIGTLTISDNSGTLQVQSSGANAPTNINSINNGTSSVVVNLNGSVVLTGAGNTGLTLDTSGNTTIAGNLTVNGTTTTVNSTTLVVNDKNIEIAKVASPTDTTADGAGITIKGATDKTFNWYNATSSFLSSENLAVASTKSVRFNGTSNYVGFKAPGTIATNVTWTLPAADASTAGFALVSDAAGTLSWAAAGAVITSDTTTTTLYPAMSTSNTGNFTAAKVNSGFTFNGATGVLTTSGGFVESSSITLKENINPITGALDAIMSLVGVTYDRKDGSKKNESGLIAEAVDAVLPSLVSKNAEGRAEGIYYSKLTAYLVEAIKDLKSQIDPLKEEIRKLKGE